MAEVKRDYEEPEVHEFARQASIQHDSLFFRYAHAPTTVLGVKDRVTGHNPLAAIYLSESYYRKIRHPEVRKG